MRLLIANHQFFPEFYTGTERFTLNLAHQLQKMGIGAEIATYGVNDNPSTFKEKGDQILFKEYVYQGVKVTSIKHRHPSRKLNMTLVDGDVLTFFSDFLDRNAFDLVHVAHPMRVAEIVRAAKRKHIPTVLTLTDFWLLCPFATMLKKDTSLCTDPQGGMACGDGCFNAGMRDELMDRFTDSALFLKNMQTICAPSAFLIEMFKRSLPEISIKLVRHGIEYSRINGKRGNRIETDNEPIIRFGFIGTILRHKGVHILIDAFRKVHKKNIRLDIYGGCFHERPYFEELKESSKDDYRISFLGEYDHGSIDRVLASMDVVVVPSVWWENSPLTILTSQANRLPVIASDIGGMREFIKNGINGYTFKTGDSDDLAAVIEKTAVSPQVLTKMRDNIQLPPRIEEEAFRYMGIYSSIINKPLMEEVL